MDKIIGQDRGNSGTIVEEPDVEGPCLGISVVCTWVTNLAVGWEHMGMRPPRLKQRECGESREIRGCSVVVLSCSSLPDQGQNRRCRCSLHDYDEALVGE